MPRKQKKYHYIYKTTNLINGKYYIGMHSTDNLNDGYIGSGKRLWYSINKYGKENFKCEILEFLPDRVTLKEREKELVNEDVLKDKMCLNIKIGGEGGNLGINGEHLGGDKFKAAHLYWETPENKERLKKRASENCKRLWKEGKFHNFNYDWTGKKHKEETKIKIGVANSINQKGERNSQYGKPRSEETKKKIKYTQLKRLGIEGNLNRIEREKIKKNNEKIKYTFNGVYFNKYRQNKILEIFGIDISKEINNINELKMILQKYYIDERKSTTNIGNIFNTNNETIRNYLILFGIERR